MITKRCVLLLLLIPVLAGLSKAGEGDGWVNLFDGKTLSGWSVHSGFAKYQAEDGTIVGTAVKGSPNTFLCTDKEFADFILEFEVMVDPELNSGVQFRSKIAQDEMVFIFRRNDGKPGKLKIPKDRVYGYQVEIATEQIGSSGGVYDEARRAFMLYDVRSDSAASMAFKDGQWNKYRVECTGNYIKTLINDIPCADFQDNLSDRGIIGLQVHDVGDNTTPYKVRWRNIRIKVVN